MIRKLFSVGGVLLLAGAVVLATASPVQAQRRGGWRGGGYRGGYWGGGYRSGYWGGYPGYYGGYGYRPYSGFGIGVYGPSYYGSSYSYPYYDGYSTYGWSSGYTPGSYDMPYTETTPSYSSGYAEESSAPASANAARVIVHAPANAEVWIGGWKTPNTGAVRDFESPSLTPGKEYTYEVRARWEENGRPVTQTQNVDVAAGKRSEVTFPMKEKVPVKPGTRD